MPSESVTFIAMLLASAFLQLCQGMRWGGVELSMPPLGSKANSCEVTNVSLYITQYTFGIELSDRYLVRLPVLSH